MNSNEFVETYIVTSGLAVITLMRFGESLTMMRRSLSLANYERWFRHIAGLIMPQKLAGDRTLAHWINPSCNGGLYYVGALWNRPCTDLCSIKAPFLILRPKVRDVLVLTRPN
jgi:hypothetical protein